MTVSAKDIETINQYANGVMNRAHHHAGGVTAIALALLGGVLWRADHNSIEIKQHDGKLANVLWFEVEGFRVALSYNHTTDKIEARERSTHGGVLFEFDNQTDILLVEKFFCNL